MIRLLPLPLLFTLSMSVACGENRSTVGVVEETPAWLTEAEYGFGDPPSGELFFRAPLVRADPARNRVFAVDGPNYQVSTWTPEGTLLFSTGRKGEGPGEFIDMGSLHIEEDGAFTVQEPRRGRYTRFTADGELVDATLGPPATAVSYQGLRVNLHWLAEGSYLGTPTIPNALEVGWQGLEPVTRKPIVRVRDLGNGEWSRPEPLLWLDVSHRAHVISVPGDGSAGDVLVIQSQPFGDPDYVQFEPGAVVVMHSKRNPGTVELIEVAASGDTAWHRRVELVPRRLTPEMVDDAVESFVAQRASRGNKPSARLRQAYLDGLHQPEYLPLTEGPPVLTASSEVWIRTRELVDTLRVYYAVPRGDPTGLPRRVLLPESLWLTDATETHVWGVRWDTLGRAHIVGRRLVPSPS